MHSKHLRVLTVLLIFFGIGMTGTASAQTLEDYSAFPPFLGPAVTPNILLLVDNSGSMNHCAYPNATVDGCLASAGGNLSNAYVSSTDYFGYYQENKCYSYSSNKFSPGGNRPCSNQWDGNFLNWLTMRRIDLTKWVMTGGLCSSVRSNANSCTTIKGQQQFSNDVCCERYYKQFDLTSVAPFSYSGLRCIRVENGNFYVRSGSSCGSSGGTTFRIWIDGVVKQTGVIQDVGNRARFGLMVFDDDGNFHNGGEIKSDIGDNLVNMINAIEGLVATSWTPLAESLFEASRYFAQVSPFYESTDYQVNTNSDPYCFQDLTPPSGEIGCKNSNQGRWVACCKSYVLLFTDGASTYDWSIPASIRDYAHDAGNHGTSTHCEGDWWTCLYPHGHPFHPETHPAGLTHATMSEHHDNCTAYFGGPSNGSCTSFGSHYLDDVAFWARTTDLRPESGNIAGINEAGNSQGLDGEQNVFLYPFFAFGTGSQLLKDAAKVGGFDDINGDGLPGPDQAEWDKDGDGVADNYFESSNAFTLKTKLVAAITAILQRSASGTSVSVLATSGSGEGAVYQAYFFPSRDDGLGEAVWLGFMQGLFFDDQGRLREDSNSDGRLVLSQDKIVETFFDLSDLETKVRRWNVDANGEKTSSTVIDLDQMLPIWEGGKILANRDLSTNPRNILTWVDTNGDGKVDSGEYIDFSTANEATLRPYLRAADPTEATNIIDFIHGEAVTGFRPRQVLVDGIEMTWRLGDIIYSSPVAVGAPAEGYDSVYGDASFTSFYDKYKNRRQVVYVGGNDGMLHAFNAGFFHPGDDTASGSPKTEHGYFTTNPRGGGGTVLGAELWAFIPQELLPHLKWLTGTDYDTGKHVYFVDGSPRIASLQIFTEEAACSNLSSAFCIHPGGWGTVLIGSMRLGGGLLPTDLNGDGDTTDPGEDRFRSAYFALDITDPEADPTLLWVYGEKDLGFTTSWPAITRYDKDTWYAVFGSGPTTYNGEREAAIAGNKFESSVSEVAQLYAIDLRTGLLVDKRAVGSETKAFMGDPAVFDIPKNYVTDVVYIGKAYADPSGGWSGRVHRLLSYGSKNPADWVLSELFDPEKPVLVKPTATMDVKGRFWIYFGTGRFFSAGPTSDQTDTSQQAMYGVKESHPKGCWDLATRNWESDCTNFIRPTSLLNVTGAVLKKDLTLICPECDHGSTFQDLVLRMMTGSGPQGERGGWRIDLFNGERVLHESSIIGGIVAVTTHTPGAEICVPQGTNAVFAVNFQTGSASPAITENGDVVGALGIDEDGTTVTRRKDLGQGVASKINVVISDNTITGLVQSSTGEIVQIKDMGTEYSIRQGTRVFQEKPE